jgi:ribonuclease G
MQTRLLMNKTSFETRVALVDQGRLAEFYVERQKAHAEVTGNIYLGRVERVLPGMQAAFIDIGLERTAFLHAQDFYLTHETQKPLERLLFPGKTCLVQVIKDPLGNKGARLHTEISIAGRWLVYLPSNEHIGISQKIGDPQERDQLREKLKALKPADMPGGFIVRTAADHASDEELLKDIHYLFSQWQSIKAKINQEPAPSLLYRDLSLAERMIRDVVQPDMTEILVDDFSLYQKIQEFCSQHEPALLQKLSWYQGDRPIFDLYNLEDAIQQLLSRKVPLPSGGYLMIDETEAFTSIDVNTGSFVGGGTSRSFSDTVFKTNLESCDEIAKQLKLRHLGGIVLIDFIDMDQESQKNQILERFKQNTSKDRVRTTVHGFSHLGILEITRKRVSESLMNVLCEPCENCRGTGFTKTIQSVCFEILREIKKELSKFKPNMIEIRSSEPIKDLLIDSYHQELDEMQQHFHVPIQLKSHGQIPVHVYDVVLF